MIFASAAALLTQPILPRHPPHTCLPLRASRLDFYVSSARNLDAPGLPHAQGTEGWAAQAAGGLAALQANNILISQTSEVRPIAVPRSLLAMCSSHAPAIRKPHAVASHLAMFRATACISYLVAHLVSCLVTCSVSCLVSHPASHRSPCPAISHSPCIPHGLHPVLHPAAYLTPIPALFPALFPALRFPGAYPTPYLASYPASCPPASHPASYPASYKGGEVEELTTGRRVTKPSSKLVLVDQTSLWVCSHASWDVRNTLKPCQTFIFLHKIMFTPRLPY